MSTQQLRSPSGRILGTIKTLPNGKMELRDNTGFLKGTYDPRSNQTKTPSGSLVGKGNLLAILLLHP